MLNTPPVLKFLLPILLSVLNQIDGRQIMHDDTLQDGKQLVSEAVTVFNNQFKDEVSYTLLVMSKGSRSRIADTAVSDMGLASPLMVYTMDGQNVIEDPWSKIGSMAKVMFMMLLRSAEVDAVIDHILFMSKLSFWRSQAYFVFLLTDEVEATPSAIKHLLGRCWKYCEIFNSVAVYHNLAKANRTKVRVSTYDPFVNGGEVYEISTMLSEVKVLSRKLRDVKGYPMEYPRHNYPPFLYEFQNSRGETEYGGFLFKIGLNVVKHMNATLTSDKKSLGNPGNWDIPYKFYEKLDVLFIISLLQEDSLQNATYPYFIDRFVLIVPKAEMLPRWMNAVIPFSNNLWILYTLSYFILVVVGKAFSYFTNENAQRYFQLLETFRLFYLGAANYVAENISLRIFTVSAMLFNIVCLNAYTGSFTSYLTVPQYYPDIKSLEDIESKSIAISLPSSYGPNLSYDFSSTMMNSDFNDEKSLLIMKRLELVDTMDEALEAVKTHKNTSIIHCLLGAKFILSKPESYRGSEPLLHMVDPEVLSLYVVLLLRRDLPFFGAIDVMLQRLGEAGLLTKATSDEFAGIELRVKKRFDVELKPLEASHLQTYFYILAAGLAAGVGAFAVELARAVTPDPPGPGTPLKSPLTGSPGEEDAPLSALELSSSETTVPPDLTDESTPECSPFHRKTTTDSASDNKFAGKSPSKNNQLGLKGRTWNDVANVKV